MLLWSVIYVCFASMPRHFAPGVDIPPPARTFCHMDDSPPDDLPHIHGRFGHQHDHSPLNYRKALSITHLFVKLSVIVRMVQPRVDIDTCGRHLVVITAQQTERSSYIDSLVV